MVDTFAQFKEVQKQGWSFFAPIEAQTTAVAGQLVKHARVTGSQRVLDVACGTGVVALTAAALGARVTGLDLTPVLLEQARRNASIAELAVDWHEGDVEQLPFENAAFDVVLSQFGHIFAPRPDVAVGEMLRVLRPGGTLAFATWPPELLIGRMFILVSRYAPPPPPGVSPPVLWGDPNVIRERLGNAVTALSFNRGVMLSNHLSPKHHRVFMEATAGPVLKLVEGLSASDPEKLRLFRTEYEALVAEYFEDNVVRHGYLLTRAVKL